ncbi:MAG: Mur ligase family protein [Methanobacteriaceae archaeon]|jgi:UDP-N-acetylmuramoyl-L-alanyl-D-glutamate--2,6-diaminopimelate ligase|nr:Mur ligase family protein [Methanobacteriaceae archaeon]MDO9626768.1 Mur ligase family protein [Methanobacteriaceae archaeon]
METRHINYNSNFLASTIADNISGKLFGPDNLFTGIFNTLGDSNCGDIIIRHWINEEGIRIAFKKGVSGIITQDAREGATELAIKYGMSLILVEKIEIANAFALKWAINEFAPESHRVVITGTNGKSTTTHMIYHILKTAKWNIYTNTDSKSEFNTLIDPMVSKQISEFAQNLEKSSLKCHDNQINGRSGPEIDALTIEVSEVQGWLDNVMKDHAYFMTQAINPEVLVITNVAMDHIGLVNSMDEVFDEIYGAVRAMESGVVVLNFNDALVRKMGESLNSQITPFYHGTGCDLEFDGSDINSGGIFFKGELLIETKDLPFKSQHFIENTLAAISACISLKVPLEDITHGIILYHALNRRFSIINENPRIIDDFAHNPDGIKATIKSAADFVYDHNSSNSNTTPHDEFPVSPDMKSKLWVVCSIRGSRGDEINQINSQALAESLNELDLDYGLIVSASSDVVDNLNTVEEHEKKIFLETLKSQQIEYIFEETLNASLKNVLSMADFQDTILLIGAQGMDPASDLIKTQIN